MPMFFVYVLWSQKLQKRYVGSTKHLARRLSEHNAGKTSFTSRGIPWTLLYSEQYVTSSEARSREIFFKSGVGRKWLDDLLHP